MTPDSAAPSPTMEPPMADDADVVERLRWYRSLLLRVADQELIDDALSALSSAKAEEREACAAICDAEHRANIHTIAISLGSDARAMTAYKLAAAIRSRKDAP